MAVITHGSHCAAHYSSDIASSKGMFCDEVVMSGKNLSIIGGASDFGAPKVGSRQGPQAMRGLQLAQKLAALGYQVVDRGDVFCSEEAPNAPTASAEEQLCLNFPIVASTCEKLCREVETALELDHFPLVLGGDHSISIGSVTGVANHYARKGADVGLIWVDTHPDLHTPQTSMSRRVYGMSNAFIGGLVPGRLQSLQHRVPAVHPKNLVYIGLRDVEAEERQAIKAMGITTFTMKDIDIQGMAQVARAAAAAASKRTAGYVVSFDLDVCDAPLVPGTVLPTRGGLTFREAHLLLELLHDDGRMLSLEMVELNPLFDKDLTTVDLAVALIESAFGKSIL